MKACETYVDLMMRSIDRDTTPQEEAELQAHLADCETCRRLCAAYQALETQLAATDEAPPDTLKDAVMNSIRAEKRQRSPKHLLGRFRFTAVAAVAAVLILVFSRTGVNIASNNSRASQTAMDTAAAPQAAAEFRAGDTTMQTETAKAAADVPEAAYEIAEEVESLEITADADGDLPPEAAQDNSVASSDAVEAPLSPLAEQAEALHAMGLYGDILQVSGLTEEALFALFPEITATALESGDVVYQVSLTYANTAAAAGEINIVQTYDDESDSDMCFILLTD